MQIDSASGGKKMEEAHLEQETSEGEAGRVAANGAVVTPAAGAAFNRGATFDRALDYLDRVKARFADQPGVYGRYLEILKSFKYGKHSIAEVLQEVTNLFREHPDLLADFKNFLPSSVAAASPANNAAASASLSSILGKKMKKKARLEQESSEGEEERRRKEERRRVREEREREKEADRDKERKERLAQKDEKRKKQRGLPDKIVFRDKAGDRERRAELGLGTAMMVTRDRDRGERRTYEMYADDFDEEQRRSARRDGKERRRRDDDDEMRWLPWRERKEAVRGERASSRFMTGESTALMHWREKREAKEKKMLLMGLRRDDREREREREREPGTPAEREGTPLGGSSDSNAIPVIENGKYIDDAQLEEEYKRVKQDWAIARKASKEFNVFFALKHRLKSRVMFREFCDMFVLFVQDVISKDEFMTVARVVVAPFRDIYRRLKLFVAYDIDEDDASLPAKIEFTPLPDELDLSDNDEQFDNEEFALRLMVELNQATMRAFEQIAHDVSLGHDALDRVNELDPLHLRNIERIYGKSGNDIVDALYDAPKAALPVILKRLRQKNAEWLSVPPDRDAEIQQQAALLAAGAGAHDKQRSDGSSSRKRERDRDDYVQPYAKGYGTRSLVSKRDLS
eukprot:TRINITY_DN2922_c0_g1_i2.p1 TRINITY_DN2922_c0_g1~~TRINITY_DN2922_c0_g1_i2.p1  ORF type:complete len:630 (+),score=297.28 TRINITY_DN2922_c0_g1_i2:1-1890(+)